MSQISWTNKTNDDSEIIMSQYFKWGSPPAREPSCWIITDDVWLTWAWKSDQNNVFFVRAIINIISQVLHDQTSDADHYCGLKNLSCLCYTDTRSPHK